MDHEGSQNNCTRNLKNVNLVPKDVQKILSSHKIFLKYNEQWGAFYEKGSSYKFLKKTPVLESGIFFL